MFRKGSFKEDKTGEINYNTYGSKMTIVEYNRYNNMKVEFEDGYITKSRYDHFKDGTINNPYDKTVYNIGYIGEGEYKTTITKLYDCWYNMIERCYGKVTQEKYPTYKGCSVCKEWYNFQTFAKWYDENYYKIEGQRMELDKDILCKGNKVYSPETCVFVPHRINTLFTKRQNYRGEYPIGVRLHKNNKNYVSMCSDTKNTSRHLGSFNTIEEAYQVYKSFKERRIKQVAEDYKSQIPKELYDAMYNWVVDITD